MGYLDDKTQVEYYKGNNYGSYQFVSLDDIINQFMVVYIGEEKMIGKASRTDVAFHAQRALAEMSFDTFKSIKSQDLPPSNTIILPHDYVNYTKVSWADSAGVEHLLYPTDKTSNPFQIKQDSNGKYSFGATVARLTNSDFSNATSDAWTISSASTSRSWSGTRESFGSDKLDDSGSPDEFLEDGTTPNPEYNPNYGQLLQATYPGWDKDLNDDGTIDATSYTGYNSETGAIIPSNAESNLPKFFIEYINDSIGSNGMLSFKHLWQWGGGSNVGSNSYGAYQHVDVSDIQLLDLRAVATSGARIYDGSTLICDYGIVRIGITTTNPDIGWEVTTCTGSGATQVCETHIVSINHKNPFHPKKPSPNANSANLDLGYLEWSDGTGAEKELLDIDVSAYDDVWVYIQSNSPFTSAAQTVMTQGTQGNIGIPIVPESATYQTHQTNTVQNVFAGIEGDINLAKANEDGNSSTWNNYKAATPNDSIDRYDDGTYDLVRGERYGLEPQNAQVNGSFYIDDLRGLINFSSSVSGKTIILDYISDGLGTNKEMKVHKLAEDAMYKHILCDLMSTRMNVPEYAIRRYKKDKFAAVRKAKLRLSNIKLEEITQIFRGKSKHIKH